MGEGSSSYTRGKVCLGEAYKSDSQQVNEADGRENLEFCHCSYKSLGARSSMGIE
jgi:hypothetical protein